MNKNKKYSFLNQKIMGFTLIELIVVIVIIGVLAAVAVPAYQRYVKKSKKRAYYATQVLLNNAIQAQADENNNVFPTGTELCCGSTSVLYISFRQVPLNPYCTATASLAFQNKAFSESAGVTLSLLGWTYTQPTGASARIDSTTITASGGTAGGNCGLPSDIDSH